MAGSSGATFSKSRRNREKLSSEYRALSLVYAECNFGIVAMCESWGYVASETIDAHNEFDFVLDLI